MEILKKLEKEIEDYTASQDFNKCTLNALKEGLETLLSNYTANGSIYNYFIKSDEDNNTEKTLKENLKIIDICVEPVKDGGVLVNRLTITPTGSIDK